MRRLLMMAMVLTLACDEGPGDDPVARWLVCVDRQADEGWPSPAPAVLRECGDVPLFRANQGISACSHDDGDPERDCRGACYRVFLALESMHEAQDDADVADAQRVYLHNRGECARQHAR